MQGERIEQAKEEQSATEVAPLSIGNKEGCIEEKAANSELN